MNKPTEQTEEVPISKAQVAMLELELRNLKSFIQTLDRRVDALSDIVLTLQAKIDE